MVNPLAQFDMIGGPPLLDEGAWWGVFVALGCALLCGRMVVPRLRGWSLGELWLLRAVAGLVPLGLIFLLTGQMDGFIARMPWWLLGLGGWFYFAGSMGWRRVRCGAPGFAEKSRIDPVAVAGWVCVGAWLAAMLAPAVAPSTAYDVLEYHLALPAQVVREGRVAPIPNVFYSAQPLLTEILLALSAVVQGNAWGAAPGLVLWSFFVLATLAFARLAARLDWPRAWRPWLWLLLLSHPIIFTLQLDRFSDWTGALMLLAGLWVSTRMAAAEDSGKTALLLGVLAAGAVGAKWTNAGTVAVPLAALAAFGGSCDQGAKARNLGLFAAASLVFFTPWSIWLWFVAGNPTAPFLAGIFPTDRWPAARLEFLLHTHGQVSPLTFDYWSNLIARVTRGLGGAPLVLLGLVAGSIHGVVHAIRRRRGISEPSKLPVVPLVVSMAIGVLLWGQLRHAAVRFLAPTHLLGLVLLGNFFAAAIRWEGELRAAKGEKPSRLRGTIAGALAIMAFAVSLHPLLVVIRVLMPVAAGSIERREFLHRSLGVTASMFEAANALPPGSRLLAIDEARGYYFTGPPALATVFDLHPVAPYLEAAADGEDLIARLRDAGYTHVLVNELESARLLAFHPPKALEADAEFGAIRANYGAEAPGAHAEAEVALAERYRGWSAFAAAPLTENERARFVEFLNLLRPSAVARQSATVESFPAIWIAELGE